MEIPGSRLSAKEKNQRGIAVFVVGISLTIANWVFERRSRGDVSFSAVMADSGARTLLLQLILFLFFLGYLAQWRYVVRHPTLGQQIVRWLIMPFSVLVAPQIQLFAARHLNLSSGDNFGNEVIFFLSSLAAYAALTWAEGCFREIKRGSNPNADSLSHGYASILYLRNPPKARSDLALLDIVAILVVLVAVYLGR